MSLNVVTPPRIISAMASSAASPTNSGLTNLNSRGQIVPSARRGLDESVHDILLREPCFYMRNFGMLVVITGCVRAFQPLSQQDVLYKTDRVSSNTKNNTTNNKTRNKETKHLITIRTYKTTNHI